PAVRSSARHSPSPLASSTTSSTAPGHERPRSRTRPSRHLITRATVPFMVARFRKTGARVRGQRPERREMSQSKTERQLNLVICLLDTRRFLSAQEIRATIHGYGDVESDTAFKRMLE